jgi:predicted GNAT family acetyltransferase
MPDVADPGIAVLDRPVWHALTGRQAPCSVGDRRALRFAAEYGPFAAAADPTGDLSALVALASGDALWLVETQSSRAPPGLRIARSAECLQMVATAIVSGEREYRLCELGDADSGEMRALAALTEPGPFSTKTHRLGRFIGVREDGRLVAMAGERMQPGRYTELSGVCTHPDHRGRGYAGFLMRTVATRILARGELPFLHCYATNAGAIALYESLGFDAHQTVIATILHPE